MSSNTHLPRGWTETTIGDLTIERVRQAPPQAKRKVHYIDISSINRDTRQIEEPDLVDAESAPTRARQWVKQGDVLVSMTRPNLNAVALVPEQLNGAVASTGFDVLRAVTVLPEWLFYRVRSQAFVADVCNCVQGVVYPAIRPRDVRSHGLPLPPLPEQRRIVSAIETQFTRLDAAVTMLERVQANLKRYRASVLKAAVEGRLVPTEVELARREGRDYEPASVLLERILKERRRKWEEAELAKRKTSGKAPSDDKWKAKYEEPSKPDTRGLPGLPAGWVWATVGQLGTVTGGITKNAKRDHLPLRLPYLRVANVYANELRLDEVSEIGLSRTELERVLLRRGDLLVVEGNGSIDQIGRVALWDGSIDPCVHQNHLIKVRFDTTELDSWVLSWLLSPQGRSFISRAASSTSGLNTLSLSKIELLPVPVCPLAEQKRIAGEMAMLLSVLAEEEAELGVTLKRSNRLRQSILKWAFEGRLVDQDPTDEPASALLDRIKAERENGDTKRPASKPRGRRKKVTA